VTNTGPFVPYDNLALINQEPLCQGAIVESHGPEDDDEFGGNDRLANSAAYAQCPHLQNEAEDHAEDAEKPNRSVRQVGDQAQLKLSSLRAGAAALL
jgi:hypothetical protein